MMQTRLSVVRRFGAKNMIMMYSNLRLERARDIEKLPEIEQLNKFLDNVRREIDVRENDVKKVIPDLSSLVDAGLLTFLGHCESRVASLLGKGFYTIGPCGEEVMGVMGAVLRESDPMALHYRHVAASVRSPSCFQFTILT